MNRPSGSDRAPAFIIREGSARDEPLNLLACPFCGETPYEAEKYYDRNEDVRIWCDHCGGLGPGRETTKEAISAWNGRAGAPQI